jgi:hypothetical protein
MDLPKVLAQLREELANLDAAILTLQRLQQQGETHRGRPPEWLAHIRRSDPAGEPGGPGQPPAKRARRRP